MELEHLDHAKEFAHGAIERAGDRIEGHRRVRTGQQLEYCETLFERGRAIFRLRTFGHLSCR